MEKKLPELTKIIDEKIETVLSDRFARYSKYIIQERALPDVRDGLKPVQRRILYSMYKEKNLSDKIYRKSAKTVGNVIGNYHPHGDQSVYEAMVRMSQDWKMRELLVDMHGNNGSIDNDPPAAMRYTEARLSKISEQLLRDIDKFTVDFVLNFDDTEKEPTVLPSKYPNLLVNGSQGISAGYATDIPPHNLKEVILATIYRLKNPLSSLDQIIDIIKGPDFPTGGIVQSIEGIRNAYESGKGRIIIRCKYEINEKKNQIIITEIPYEVNKSNILKKIEDIRLNKKLNGISEARDETDKNGLRIVIVCKKDANKDLIINYLLKNTDLKINYNFNMVVIHNKHPKQSGLLTILDAYIEHQKEVIINRSNYELEKSRKRLHILEGLVKMVSILDEVIYVIRHSKNKADAKENIIEKFAFSLEQAEAIVTLQLYRLTYTDVDILEEEARSLTTYINELIDILNNENRLVNVIINELEEIKNEFKTPRRTEIQEEVEEIQIDKQEMIKSEDVLLNISKEGYIRILKNKNIDNDVIKSKLLTKKDYFIVNKVVNTLDKILLFTNKGNYILLNVHQINIVKNNELKQHLNDFVRIEPHEYIVKIITINEFKNDKLIIMATKDGFIKRTPLEEFNTIRNNKKYSAISFKSKNDRLVNAYLSDNYNRDIVITTKLGYINKYEENQVSVQKLKAAGIKSINLKENDEVVSFNYIYNVNCDLILITQRGNIKKLKPNQLVKSIRTNRGSMTLKSLKKNSHNYVGAVLINNEPFIVEQGDNIYLITNDLPSYSETVSNGKLYDKFKQNENIIYLIEITTNQTNLFSYKETKDKKRFV